MTLLAFKILPVVLKTIWFFIFPETSPKNYALEQGSSYGLGMFYEHLNTWKAGSR
jgi:hypothetical protein